MKFKRKKGRFGNRKEVANKEEEKTVPELPKGKNQEIKNTQVGIKKLRANVGENESGEFIIERNKPPPRN